MKKNIALLILVALTFSACGAKEPIEPIEEPTEEVEEVAEQPTCEGEREYQDWMIGSRELLMPSETSKKSRTYKVDELNLSFQISSEFDDTHPFVSQEGTISFEKTTEVGCTSYGDEVTPFLRTSASSISKEFQIYEHAFDTPLFTVNAGSEAYLGGNNIILYEFTLSDELYIAGFLECRMNCEDREVEGKDLIHEVLNSIEFHEKSLTEEYAEALIVKLEEDDEFLEEGELYIDELDSENYYGVINGPFDGAISFTIFLRKTDTPVLALDQRGCGPLCMQTLTFYTYDDAVWTDVSDLFPLVPEEDLEAKKEEVTAHLEEIGEKETFTAFIYNLPQSGTAIEMVDQYDVFRGNNAIGLLYKFEWDWETGSFTMEEVY